MPFFMRYDWDWSNIMKMQWPLFGTLFVEGEAFCQHEFGAICVHRNNTYDFESPYYLPNEHHLKCGQQHRSSKEWTRAIH